jgi:thioredoxin reductase
MKKKIIIIGGGIAGLSAGSKRGRLKTRTYIDKY